MTVTDTLLQAPATTQSGLDFDAVLCTHEAIPRILPETPTWPYPLLSAEAEAEATIRRENVQSIGASKARGEVTPVMVPSPEERRRGVVTASTNNHAQLLAWVGARSEVPMTVIAPVGAPARKAVAVCALGARVVVEGEMMCELLAHAKALALREGMRMVSPKDEPTIVLGYAIAHLELFCHHPDLEAAYVPIGSGSGAAGAYPVRGALTPGCRITGTRSSAAPAVHRAWASGESATIHSHTCAVGLAVGASFTLIQSVLGRSPNDFILIDDGVVQGAVSLLVTHAHTLAEGVGVASLIGLMADPACQDYYAIVCTDGNVDDHELTSIPAGISARVIAGTDTALSC